MPKLTDKQTLFCKEYLIDLNATQAAIRAKYSKKTAQVIGAENLAKPMIQQEIKRLRKKAQKSTDVTIEKVLIGLSQIAFADIRKAVKWGVDPTDETSENANPNGLNIYPVSLVPSELIDDNTVAAVSEVSLNQNGIKIKMYDKSKALVDIGRYLGMFDQKPIEPSDSESETLAKMAEMLPD